jgi:APA family basic amino acid/polyamine antiporter
MGFDAIASAAEETKNPQRSIPIGIIGSLAICSIIYIAVTAVMDGMVPFVMFTGSEAPVMMALEYVGVKWATTIITVGAIAGLTTVILVNLFVVPRLIFAMSRDNLLPKKLAKVHAHFNSPAVSIGLVGIVTAFIAGLLPLGDIFELVNMAALTAFIFLALSVIILRKTRPDIPRKFKCPLVPMVPVISILACLALISQLTKLTVEIFAIWTVLGLIFYFAYRKYKNSWHDEDTSSNASLNTNTPLIQTMVDEKESGK